MVKDSLGGGFMGCVLGTLSVAHLLCGYLGFV